MGTRGEIEASAPYHSRHSGVLIDGKLLLDVGEEEFLKKKPEYIFISHLHPDHAFFVLKSAERIDAKVYAPEKHKNYKNLVVISKKTKANGYLITPIPTHHSKKVKSTAYLIQKNKAKILYTGDMIWIDKKYHHLLKNLDLVITEASYYRKGGLVRKDKETGELFGHTGIPNLINLFKKFTSAILFVHFGGWFYKNMKESRRKITKLAKQNNIRALIGYDGYETGLKSLQAHR